MSSDKGLLVLSRRVGETLMIELDDQLVEVTVLGIKGSQVRIGTKADRSVAVNREEIYDRIKSEEIDK